MSFFFDDDPPAPTSKNDKKKKKQAALPPIDNGSPAHTESSQATATPAVASSRFVITHADVAAADDRQKAALTRRFFSSAKGSGCDADSSNAVADEMQKSMAIAQRRRAQERDEAIMIKLKKEREADALNPELVEKDLHVGVFMTGAYKKAKRALKGLENDGDQPSVLTVRGDDVEFDYDDDDDDAAEELRPSRRNLLAGSSNAAFYDSLLEMRAAAAVKVDVHARDEAEATATMEQPVAVTLDPVTPTAAADPPIGDGVVPSNEADSKSKLQEAADAAQRKFDEERRAARERRCQPKWDAAMLEAARKRFLQRQADRLKQPHPR